jgi:hypothetical protein
MVGVADTKCNRKRSNERGSHPSTESILRHFKLLPWQGIRENRNVKIAGNLRAANVLVSAGFKASALDESQCGESY